MLSGERSGCSLSAESDSIGSAAMRSNSTFYAGIQLLGVLLKVQFRCRACLISPDRTNRTDRTDRTQREPVFLFVLSVLFVLLHYPHEPRDPAISSRGVSARASRDSG